MKPLIFFLLVWLAALPLAAAPPPLIFDTDITGDVDDVLALAMLHAVADRGACRPLGITISKRNAEAVGFVDAFNTAYGRPDLPLGITRDERAQLRSSKFTALAASLKLPHDLRSADQAEDAVALLRRLLAAEQDQSVLLVSVGIASNLANLLQSSGGTELVRRKVKLLSIMAGAFGPVQGRMDHREANVINGLEAMRFVTREWPADVPVVWSGFEIGIALPFAHQSILEDLSDPRQRLLREAYLAHSGPSHDRPCWDPSSLLYALWPQRGYFGLSAAGRVHFDAQGHSFFSEATGGRGRDRYLTLNPQQQARALEAIITLTTQPPR
jgi:purine nucleosidase